MTKPIIPVVRDPGTRYFLRMLRRALIMITAAIDAVAPEEAAERPPA